MLIKPCNYEMLNFSVVECPVHKDFSVHELLSPERVCRREPAWMTTGPLGQALTALELFVGLASPLHCPHANARGDNMTLPIPPETPDPMIDDPALPDTTPERDPPPTMPPVIPTPVGDPPADEPPAVL